MVVKPFVKRIGCYYYGNAVKSFESFLYCGHVVFLENHHDVVYGLWILDGLDIGREVTERHIEIVVLFQKLHTVGVCRIGLGRAL